MLSRGLLTEKEREERRLRKELEKAEKLLSWHQALIPFMKAQPMSGRVLSRGPLTEKEREERRLRKELEKAEKLLSRHQAREDKENVKQAQQEERDKAREVTKRNASRMAMEDLQVRPSEGSCILVKITSRI